MENKKYFQVSYEVGNTYSSNIAIAECVDDVVDYYKVDGYKEIGASRITKEEAEASLRRHPGKPVIEIPKQERQKSILDELKKNLDMLCFSEDILEVLYDLNISTVDEIEERLPEIKKKADFDTYNIISQAVRTRNAVIKATKAETSVVISDQVPVMSSEEYEALAAEKANEAVDDGLKWTTIGIIYLAVGMKIMRDGKLYKRFNFRNFEEYCAQKGITRQQGAKYANIGDMLERRIQQETGNENVKLLDILSELEQRLNQSTRNGKLLPILQNAGVEAGYLLAKLEDADLDEVIQTVNPEETNGADVKRRKKEISVLSDEDTEKLNDYLLDDRKTISTALLVAMHTGIRIGEMCGLRWSDIDFCKKCIHIQRSVKNYYVQAERRCVREIGETKTMYSNRRIYMTDDFADILRNRQGTGFIYTGTDRYIDTCSARQALNRRLEKLDIPHIRFHALRHGFATRAIQKGVDPKTVAAILGHAHCNITLDIYTSCTSEMQIDAMRRLETK